MDYYNLGIVMYLKRKNENVADNNIIFTYK